MRSSARPALRIVESRRLAPPGAEALPAESHLRSLFAEEQRIERELLKVRNSLRFYRGRYAAENGLLAAPRIELLRTRFAPAREGNFTDGQPGGASASRLAPQRAEPSAGPRRNI
jgi:hypothetical protein